MLAKSFLVISGFAALWLVQAASAEDRWVDGKICSITSACKYPGSTVGPGNEHLVGEYFHKLDPVGSVLLWQSKG